jgi:hypothetical protein
MNDNVIEFTPKNKTECTDETSAIEFKSNKDTVILKIKNNGNIVWNSPNGEVVIADQESLGVALIGVIAAMTDHIYDYSLISEGLWQKYVKFLESRK